MVGKLFVNYYKLFITNYFTFNINNTSELQSYNNDVFHKFFEFDKHKRIKESCILHYYYYKYNN